MEKPVDPDLMRVYYDRLFPVGPMFRWLSYKNDPDSQQENVVQDYFSRREFSMTLPGDIYVRYKSFETQEAFRKAINEMQPEKIDIGAVYSIPPRLHACKVGRGFVPEQRELVFDIDMDDYDGLRTCCEKAAICCRCWKFMACAIRCLHAALTKDFGFRHVLFVFSGRRGVHCWVSDEAARSLPNDARSALAEYLHLVNGKKKVEFITGKGKELHPSIRRAVRICHQALTEKGGILDVQGVLEPHREKFSQILDQLPSETATALKEKCASKSSREVFAELSSALKEKRQRFLDELTVELAYPRLDINVSKAMNHLLKAPFCVHPKSGKVCVPVLVEEASEFNPDEVPTLRGLVAALSEGAASPLDKSVRMFKRFVDGVIQDVSSQRSAEADAAMEF